ncbi:MAG TPA: response regulator [Polyangia bacterium]|nr:response regulator [Polyangia bacterium]
MEPIRAAAPAPRGPDNVLIVDPDAVSRRFVEIALGGRSDLRLLAATDGGSALEILATTRVHLILAETDFGDMNGLQLFRRLIQETRLSGVPFVFLSADTRVTTRRAAFAAGVDDFLAKPCDGDVLATRVRALIARERRSVAAASRANSFDLGGRFAELALPDLVTFLEQGRRSGTISVACSDGLGTIFLDQGRVVHAVFGTLVGPQALMALATDPAGRFEFSLGPCRVEAAQQTITEWTQFQVMQDARAGRTKGGTTKYFAVSAGASQISGPTENAAAAADPNAAAPAASRPAAPARTNLIPAFIPDPGSATLMAEAVQDGFTLGDLMSFTDEDLSRWTGATPARDRFHVLLVADLPQGISALLPLAGAPTDDWILRSLSPKVKALGLSFFLRRERLLDLVLVDIREPGRFSESLRRTPSAMIVAPPGAEPETVGVRARVELADLACRLTPPVTLVAGDAMLKKALRSITSRSGGEIAVRGLPSLLGAPGADLRTVLAEGIRLCAGARRS